MTKNPGNQPTREGERIAKRIAHAGVASRREAERLILEGRVMVDGKTIETPATLVTEKNVVCVDGEVLSPPKAARLFRYYKPVGLITTTKDPEGRPTIFDDLSDKLPRLISVGRLDIGSEGLLLLTTDGDLARHLEHPSTGWSRGYRVRVHGTVTPQALKALEKGVTVDGVRYNQIKAELERRTGANAWLKVSLTEGKNREIRRIMNHLGLDVSRLMRMSYGPFQLGNLKKGEVKEITGKALKEQMGEWKK